MNSTLLTSTAQALVTKDKGILAMDESNPTCKKRSAALGIPQTEEPRRAYREMLVTTPQLGECISGAILYVETIRQQTKDGTPFLKVLTDTGIIPGIKVDTGAKALAAHPRETITEGLDGLRERLNGYFRLGGRFAKWRVAIPIVEPEVLMTGDHSLVRCLEVTREVLRNVFLQLNCQRVILEGMLLKPWKLAFSLGRAIQQPALEIWSGQEANVPAAREVLLHRAQCNRAARRGEYIGTMERCLA
jgi:fructose-bisphosphate aldolase class I